MNAKRNLIPILLLCAALLPAVVQAQFIFTTNNDGSLNLYQYTGSDSDAIIPSTTNGLPVTSIGSGAFNNVPTLISVTIPSSITNYGWAAFADCASLRGVYFQGNAPTNFYPGGIGVFSHDKNATLYYVQGTTVWGSTFDGLPTMQWNPQVLTQLIYTNIGGQTAITGYTGSNGVVTIPITINGLPVTSIGSNAFFNCTSLTSINIPNSVTNIGDWAFQDCNSLTGVFFQGNAPAADSTVFDGDNNVTNYYLPQTTGWGLTFAGRQTMPVPFTYTTYNGTLTITRYTGSGGQVNIPSAINGLPVISIGSGFRGGAFTGTTATGVTIPNSVTSIGDNAFINSSYMTSVTIPDSVTNIGSQAFSLCRTLSTITVDAFNNFYSSVHGVLFNKSQTTLIQCPAGISGSYIIPNTVTTIGDNAFYYCSGLTGVIIPDSVTTIGYQTFAFCSGLTSVTIPNNITTIENNAFISCYALQNVTIPNSIISINAGSFEYCGLTNITIPSSVTGIGSFAFWDCSSLVSVYCQGDAPNVDWTVFQYAPSTVYYLPGTTGWDAFSLNAGVPTALWLLPNPLILNSGPGFGVQTNVFGFIISWATNIPVVVESCTNLANPVWSPMGTNTLTEGTSYFSDPQWTNYPGRFYRLRSP